MNSVKKAELKLVKKIQKNPTKRDVRRLAKMVSKDNRFRLGARILSQALHDGLMTEREILEDLVMMKDWDSMESALVFCISVAGCWKLNKELANVYADMGQMAKAVNACNAYLFNQDNSNVRAVKAGALANLGNIRGARMIYYDLLDDEEMSDKAFCDLAFIEIRQGNKDLAMDLISNVNTPPLSSTHQWGTIMKMAGRHNEAIKKMRIALKSKMSDNLRKTILFSLGAILDESKRYEEAYKVFEGGNKLYKNTYNSDREIKTLAGMKEIFNKEDFSKALDKSVAIKETTPIFIIGMPRSGTSLTEQILSSHSKIEGKGELECAGKNTFICDSLTELNSNILTDCSLGYLDCAGVKDGYFTDKMPANFAMVGSLALMFPGAKFINVQRDEDDLAVGIWTTDFASPHPYAYNLKDIKAKMKAYQGYVDHWKSIGIEILDVKYEEIVNDTVGTVDRLFDHIGLDVEEQCYSPHDSDRVVKTASWAQVRQPIHSKSIGRAGNYKELFKT